jgi:hypothetical protein
MKIVPTFAWRYVGKRGTSSARRADLLAEISTEHEREHRALPIDHTLWFLLV